MPARKPKTLLRIGEAAQSAGVSTQTVEYYVMLGLITPINEPRDSRRRFFDDKLVRRIRLIRELNETGYTLREIRQTWLQRR